MTKIVCNTEFNVNQFDWSGNTGVQEISVLSHGSRRPVFSRVWDDSCDDGLVVVGKRETITFVVAKTDFVGDTASGGEIGGWVLQSINTKTNRVDNRFKLLIIND